jgi:hypothetical protein
MALLTRFLKQTVVYWEPTGTADASGKRTFESPVELSVRWEDKQAEFLDDKGVKHLSQALIYVGQALLMHGYVFLGSLTDLNSDQDPYGQEGAYPIRGFQNDPSVDGTDQVRKYFLSTERQF